MSSSQRGGKVGKVAEAKGNRVGRIMTTPRVKLARAKVTAGGAGLCLGGFEADCWGGVEVQP